MRVLAACSLGGAGHLQPLLPVLAVAQRRGDEVRVVGPPALRTMVERAGHVFEVGGEPPEDEVAPIREQLPVAPPAEAAVLGNRELFGRLATAAMLPRMYEICDAWRPDRIVRDPAEFASAVVGGELGIPTAQVAISLATVEMGSIALAAPALDAYREGMAAELQASPYLTRFPSSLDPSAFATTMRFRSPAEVAGDALPDWWSGLDAPLVYVTFGTVLGYMTIAADVFRAAVEAVAALDARVLLTVGHRFDRAALRDLPEHVHVENWVDQSRVLREADVVVCHGGSGTVLGALGASVPLVVVPLFADQFENARRVASVGAGVVVESDVRPPASGEVIGPAVGPGISSAIADVRGSTSYRHCAVVVATEMTSAPSLDAVLDALFTG
jgi:UDP:flavonoid glycosyltransferase YjiC (YdhE family)